jgi:hypothetical protein
MKCERRIPFPEYRPAPDAKGRISGEYLTDNALQEQPNKQGAGSPLVSRRQIFTQC